MKIRNKILISFSATSILLVGIILVIIYLLFSEYREEDFQQRQKEKIITTLNFVTDIEKNENELIDALNRLSINSILNEKLLIFDGNKKLIYSSLDDVAVNYADQLLAKLNQQNPWIEQKDGLYDVIAIRFTTKSKDYYGISKAFDEFGYSKLSMLKTILFAVFLFYTMLVILISIYIANRISKPISSLATLLGKYRIGESQQQNHIVTDTFEIDYLNTKFNELVSRTNNAYAFQKNAVHHISHQLKTPIAILISELERMKKSIDNTTLKADFDNQISKTKSLAEIIDTLLQISKIKIEQQFEKKQLRIDEVIFDCINEANILYPNYIFEVNYLPSEPDANLLVIKANEMLMKQAFQNLLNNCIAYSDQQKAEITIDISQAGTLRITFSNIGKIITQEEKQYLFSHFFRGENSRNKIGFGLGLVLTKNIIEIHKGEIIYSNPIDNVNNFEVIFPTL